MAKVNLHFLLLPTNLVDAVDCDFLTKMTEDGVIVLGCIWLPANTKWDQDADRFTTGSPIADAMFEKPPEINETAAKPF